ERDWSSDVCAADLAPRAMPTAVGMARGATMMESESRVVAVVGDASIFNGVAFEGLNQAGTLRRQLLVILNDNAMGIAPSQGGMAEHLAKFRTSRVYEEVKKRVKKYLPQVPLVGKATFDALDHLKEGLKATVSPHQIFEQLGFVYVGPTDGHDIEHLIELLDGLKDVQHPVLLHVHTEKGRGADFAMAEPTRFHSPKPFKVEGRRVQIQGGARSYTEAFADAMIDVANEDKRVFALTAAMPDGTGLAKFQDAYPERYLDGGIAESGTVDIAAGMCKAGMRPVAAIYSTFLQRAFDQVFQEVSLQRLPVVFCLDRAGLVGGDGAVHHGFLDIAFLRGLPKMVLMAPGDGDELTHMLRFALSLDSASAIRYPRASVPVPLAESVAPIELGRSVRIRDGKDATILAYGSTCRPALDAAIALRKEGIDVRVVNARFVKPIDSDMVAEAFASGAPVITAEEHSPYGGFGAAVLEAAQTMGLPTTQLVRLAMPADDFVPHGSRADQLRHCLLDAEGIASTVRRSLSDADGALKLRGRGSVRSAG
ncbi:MAG TPA: 1-deoxy-D-xylulose-5-phosphate synthase, partial [Phycisphaerae bacterium]|nr:1-deoxy-D-xylulose-5-phosphate synthase [Phycisphaerae bacterium]